MFSLSCKRTRNPHIVYAPVALVVATLPHREVNGTEFVRRNGRHTLSILAPSRVGLPYGVIPRLLVIWITTQAKIAGQREIKLGDSCRAFLKELGIQSTGGKNGSIGRLRKQMRSLLQCTISISEHDENLDVEYGMRLADHSALWWSGDQLQESFLHLSSAFFYDITKSAFPIDVRAIRELRQSPLALDIYLWLTYRVYRLTKPCVISWADLQKQFGTDYAKQWHFEKAFTKHLQRVKNVYPELIAQCSAKQGLYLHPSKTHVLSNCG